MPRAGVRGSLSRSFLGASDDGEEDCEVEEEVSMTAKGCPSR